jgi:acetyl esterase
MKTTLRLLVTLVVLVSGAAGRAASAAYPPVLEGARQEIYKRVGDTALALWIYEPETGAKTSRPAIVFFFGGGWSSGSPQQFEPQCRALAARGMVAITADYRVATRQQAKAADCVADAKSAVRWLRKNAARLGLDPDRIAAGGGSAGGHIAAATLVPGFDTEGEDPAVSCAPNALVLFNPALVLAPLPGLELKGFGVNLGPERLGAPAVALSPAHHIRGGMPPTIIFHGRADTTVPFATAEAYARAMQAAGNRCELVGYDGEAHGFFNATRKGGKYPETLAAADAFLVSLGYLPARVNGR